MNTFERGSIVEFGPPSARRVGVVVGAFDDYQRGETLCVLTPEARVKGQAFDACPVSLMNVQPASLDDLRAHAAEVKRAIAERIDAIEGSLVRV